MYEPYLGEIQWVAFNFAPKGWALCNGQLLPISQNEALFSLLGVTYGGDGRANFALPDLRGRLIEGVGVDPLGTRKGTETHTLTAAEMPTHLHGYPVSDRRGTTGDPQTGVAFASGVRAFASPAAANASLGPGAVTNAGSGQPHQNMQPYLVLNAVIALQGVFPSAT